MPSNSKIIRHSGQYRWRGIKKKRYKIVNGDWLNISRHVIVGDNVTNPSMHLRYFEIQKGGKSSLEYHRHEHIVVCIRGQGFIRLGKKRYPLRNLDVVYISPKTIHQLTNPYDEPFGFLCIVKSKRDKPILVKNG
ncbi:MAG: cupin domain-containing protein [Thermodesulfovibrionales bacterium]|nr:cupin domain-containing protein [Thermodesulfovibrionales bacterium]